MWSSCRFVLRSLVQRTRQGHRIQTTATQAVLSFTVSDPSQCTVQVFSDAAQTHPVDDVSAALFPGSQQCNRAGSAIQGKTVSFVAGLRTSQKASDGKLHSRALASQTAYYYTITDLADSQTTQGSFTTSTLPLGSLYPEQPPFDPNAWDNRAYPQFDWTISQRNQALADPLTGQLVKASHFCRRRLRGESKQHRRSGRSLGDRRGRGRRVFECCESECLRRELRQLHRRGQDLHASSRVSDDRDRRFQKLVSPLQRR